jgi:hypothetical protein
MKTVLLVSLALAGLSAWSCARATVIAEDFATDPLAQGWRSFGQASLFHWNPTNQNLEVTWDSAQPNSYFYHPLGTILTTNDEFSFAFDIQVNDASGTGFFELAVGFLNFKDATNPNFARGTGSDSPNLVEFNYFPDTGWGPTLSCTMTDTNSRFNFLEDFVGLDSGVTYHVVLTHAAGAALVSGQVFREGQLYTALPVSYLATNFTDFRLDTIAVSSYTATNDPWGDSLLAHGSVTDFVVTVPPPPVQNLTVSFSNAVWRAQFISQSNWLYTLERAGDLLSWTNVFPAAPGNGTHLYLPDTDAPADRAFYRVRAERP